VVRVRLGAGLLIALAVGAAAAGPLLPAGIALAGLLALGSLWAVPPGRRAGNPAGAMASLARVTVFASAFGGYLVPGRPGLAAAGLVAGVLAADLVGVRLPDGPRRWITVTLVLAAAVLIGVCVAISPVRVAMPTQAPSVPGVLLATAIMFPLLIPDRQALAVWRICGSTMVALAVAGVALYQLGPERLGLSPTSLLELLAAADASALAPLLTVVVVVAAVPAALTTFTEASSRLADRTGREVRATKVICGVLTAAVAALACPAIALVLAATLTFAEVLIGLVARYGERRA
jgi:hypothetical protein